MRQADLLPGGFSPRTASGMIPVKTGRSRADREARAYNAPAYAAKVCRSREIAGTALLDSKVSRHASPMACPPAIPDSIACRRVRRRRPELGVGRAGG